MTESMLEQEHPGDLLVSGGGAGGDILTGIQSYCIPLKNQASDSCKSGVFLIPHVIGCSVRN